MVRYLAKEGERLDVIIYAYYDSLDVFEEVLNQNPHLVNSIEMKRGDIVYLLTFEQDIIIEDAISLW